MRTHEQCVNNSTPLRVYSRDSKYDYNKDSLLLLRCKIRAFLLGTSLVSQEKFCAPSAGCALSKDLRLTYQFGPTRNPLNHKETTNNNQR